MAEAYIYCADIYCAHCGEAFRKEITDAGHAPADPENESSYDSDEFPKGPYPDGGGEADSPQHCGGCGVFLENPLTGDGYAYLREQAEASGSIVVDPDDIDEIDIEASAEREQAAWTAKLARLPASSLAHQHPESPLAQWLRYYPEAWHPANR